SFGLRHPRATHSCPTRRSSDLVFLTAAQPPTASESRGVNAAPAGGIWVSRSTDGGITFSQNVLAAGNENRLSLNGNLARDKDHLDRKSTRLNSSHVSISYAVCS